MTRLPAPPVDRIDVWIVSLSGDEGQYERARDSLSADECSRADRFVFDEHRRRFALGRGALRGILALYCGCTPREIRFAYGEHGKPRLADCAGGGSLQFNTSGSQQLGVCAVTVGRPVGIDVEFIRPNRERGLVELFFAEGERAAYDRLSDEERLAAFYRAWTRKEAYLKAHGTGLTRPLSSFEVTIAPGEPARLVADRQATPGGGAWTLADLDLEPGYAGALAVAGGPLPIGYCTWPPSPPGAARPRRTNSGR